MSSFTILAIAVDRHRMICRPTYRQVTSQYQLNISKQISQIGFGWAVLLCLAIFLTALLFCLPLYFKTRLHSLTNILVGDTEDDNSSPRFGDFGDVANRAEMRRQMSCKPFQWYLDTVATRVPRPSLIGAGEIRHGSVCLEINDRVDFIGQQIEARECGNSTGNGGPLPDIYVQPCCLVG